MSFPEEQLRVALQQNHALEKKVAELETVVGELSRRLKLNSRNSSKPLQLMVTISQIQKAAVNAGEKAWRTE